MNFNRRSISRFASNAFVAAWFSASATLALSQQLVAPAQPGAAAPVEPANGAVLNAYPVAVERAETLYQQLTQQFPPASGVRISYDARTSQLLVFAPPATHQQISATLGIVAAPDNAAAGPDMSPQNSEANAGVAATAPRGPKIVPLTRLEPAEFEAALNRIFGRKLPVSIENDGQWARYTLQTRGGRVNVIVDRPAKQVALEGPVKLADAWAKVIESIDKQPRREDENTVLVPLVRSRNADVAKALSAFQAGDQAEGARPRAAAGRDTAAGRLVSMLFQQPGQDRFDEAQPDGQPLPEGMREGDMPLDDEQGPPGDETGGALIGTVRIEPIEGLDAFIIQGHPDDVERVMAIINQIEQLSAVTEPAIEIYNLRHVSSQAISTLVQQIYDQVLSQRQGPISITPLIKPNSLLLIGRPEAIDGVVDLIRRLDMPVGPAAMFNVYPLRHVPATMAKQTVDEFFLNRTGLAGRPTVVAEFRTNSIIVQGSPSDLQEVQALVRKIDIATTPAVNELRIIPLRNSTAEEMAQTLLDAISAEEPGRQQGQQFQVPGQVQQPGQQGQTGQMQPRSTALQFVTVDGQVRQGLRSGVLADVRITPDIQKNALVVSAPAESMDLIVALVAQLDQMPAAEVQIKVFQIINGDVTTLITMLQNLFGQQATQQQAGGGFFGAIPQQAGPTGDGAGLVPVRFSFDQRTNSIIASGSPSELGVVEAVLARLDDIDVRTRESRVYRLKNVPALDVANTIMQFLQMEQQLQNQAAVGTVSALEQFQRQVVVVPEPVSNSLIVSATPRYYEEVMRWIEEIDRRPPMVMIQVLIAEVQLNNTDEFGVELGLQDSVLFDRSLVGVPDFITRNITTTLPNGAQTTTQEVVGASNVPGFNFNNGNPLGNSASDRALRNSATVGTQGLSNFALGRTNTQLGYGGFVLSASSESVSVLLRALAECRRLDVLSSPTLTTMDNQQAFIQAGQQVPRIVATNITPTGTINTTELDDVGIILGVWPRVSPDGLVVMQINAIKSEVGPEAEGIPISINEVGEVIRSPRYNTSRAETTVSALSGQTIVLGGLITSRKEQFHRRVPYLSNIPIIGNLFRYDGTAQRRTELLIIMTPHIVRSADDMERLKQQEAARMSWCLGDVTKMYGEAGLRNRHDDFLDSETEVVYPDVDAVPTPAVPGETYEELGPVGKTDTEKKKSRLSLRK